MARDVHSKSDNIAALIQPYGLEGLVMKKLSEIYFREFLH